MKIIVDAMGGDNAPQAIVQGALDANKLHGVDIVLVGRGRTVTAPWKELNATYLRLCRKLCLLEGQE